MDPLRLGRMFAFLLKFLLVCAVFFLLSCSSGSSSGPDDSNDDINNPWRVEKTILDSLLVNSVGELPSCKGKFEGKGALIGNQDVFICANGQWQNMAESAENHVGCKDGFLVSESESLNEEKAGIKVYGQSTFAFGASITVKALDSAQFYRPGNVIFSGCVVRRDGSYVLNLPEDTPEFVQISITGYHKNLVRGSYSRETVTLNGVAGVKDGDTVNVHLLTHLEAPRVEQYISYAGGRANLRECKYKAQQDIFVAFEMDTSNFYTNPSLYTFEKFYTSEKFFVSGYSEHSAALTALYAMVQGGR
ncbi:MAG: hypothetical protein HUK21_12765, partial [Fibrobacteraceae bacterium]|nr:hypothetical protein [Fibrobacteraceae bacterium]